MNKIFAIGIKDLQLILRDRAALLLMLAAPFLITLGMGFVSGAFEDDGGDAGISDIPTIRKSNQFQPPRKNERPKAMMRIATSTAKMAMMIRSRVCSRPPQVSITVADVSSPSVTAFTTIKPVIAHCT